MKLLFIISAVALFYIYLGYPLLVFLISRFFKEPERRKFSFPTISVILSVYNEQKYILNKLESLLQQNYPEDRIEILIGSDGSTDKTNQFVLAYSDARIKFFPQNQRMGKPSILNLLTKQATGEILLFTDARQVLEHNAIKQLISNFEDVEVGSVSGMLLFKDTDQSAKTKSGIGLYWKYEKFIRKCESRMGSMLGATGAFYAIRKDLYPELPKDIILDDVYIPMKIVDKGYRAIFDDQAIIYDEIVVNKKDEFLRKTRTLAGNFQLFYYLKHLFNPFKGIIAWQFFSHKFLRLIAPFFLISLLISNFFLIDYSIFRVTLVLQIVFYGLASLSVIVSRPCRFIDIPSMFCVMNAAAIVGFFRFILKSQTVHWEKTGNHS